MNAKQRIAAALALAMSVGLAGCGGQAEQTQTQETAIPTATETAPAQAETAPAAEEGTRVSAAAGYAAAIDNATLDAETYLDYAAGIEAGVYKWVLSEDGDYYALAAVDESGAPISNRVAVMYLGQIVELTDADTIFADTLHPYSIALLSAVPKVEFENRTRRIVLEGDVPSPLNPVEVGCRFANRCWMACEDCKTNTPELTEVKPGHFVKCPYWAKSQEMAAQRVAAMKAEEA